MSEYLDQNIIDAVYTGVEGAPSWIQVWGFRNTNVLHKDLSPGINPEWWETGYMILRTDHPWNVDGYIDHYVTKAKLLAAIEIIKKNYPHSWDNIQNDNSDA